MFSFGDRDLWRRKRREAFQSARECREALTVDRHYDHGLIGGVRVKGVHHALYSGQPNHPNVIKAVNFWLSRARRAHAIVMGWEPVISNFVIVTETAVKYGQLYAK